MASKFVVFVAFVAVAQASLAAADIQSYQKETLAQWDRAADILFNCVEDQPSDFDTVQSQYLNAGYAGALAFAKAALGEDQTTLPKEPTPRYTATAKDVVGAVRAAATATSQNLGKVESEIDSDRKLVPVKDGVKAYYSMAKSTASQDATVAVLDAVYDKYFAAFKALAEKLAGKSKSVDVKSLKAEAYDGINKFVGLIYGLLSKKD